MQFTPYKTEIKCIFPLHDRKEIVFLYKTEKKYIVFPLQDKKKFSPYKTWNMKKFLMHFTK